MRGYDPGFLSERIELAKIYAPALAKGLVAPLLSGSGHELAYHHFSICNSRGSEVSADYGGEH